MSSHIFTIDTRNVFTAHKSGCAHLGFRSQGKSEPFDVDAITATREAIRAEVADAGFDDYDLAFGPCLKDLP